MAKRALMTVAAMATYLMTLAPLVVGIGLDGSGCFLACFAYFAVFGFALSGIESWFFFEGGGPVRLRHWIGGFAMAAVNAGVATLLFSDTEGASLADAVASWFDRQGADVWLRLGYSAISFMVVYCVVGSATWPFVKDYYQGPNATLQLKVPSGRVIIPLQVVRGVLATAAMLPLLAGLGSGGEITTWLALFLTLAFTSGILPMVSVEDWPTRLRVIHGIEISVFSLIQAFAWWWWLLR